MKKQSTNTLAIYTRNFIFGVEDSLVSTVGLLSGVAVAGVPKNDIFIAGVVLIFVEAFSMGVGSYLSEDFTEHYVQKNSHSHALSLIGASIMLISYFASGFIPLSPYLIFDVSLALPISIIMSLATLFLLGAISAKFYNVKVIKNGIKMLTIGGLAILIGFIVGKSLSSKSVI